MPKATTSSDDGEQYPRCKGAGRGSQWLIERKATCRTLCGRTVTKVMSFVANQLQRPAGEAQCRERTCARRRAIGNSCIRAAVWRHRCRCTGLCIVVLSMIRLRTDHRALHSKSRTNQYLSVCATSMYGNMSCRSSYGPRSSERAVRALVDNIFVGTGRGRGRVV